MKIDENPKEKLRDKNRVKIFQPLRISHNRVHSMTPCIRREFRHWDTDPNGEMQQVFV